MDHPFFVHPYFSKSVLVIGITLVVSIVSKLADVTGETSLAEQRIGKQLVSKAKEWYLISKQDASPLVAFEHAIYAIAYLNSARQVTSETYLEKACGINIHALVKTIDAHFKQLSKHVGKQCPKMKYKSSGVSWA